MPNWSDLRTMKEREPDTESFQDATSNSLEEKESPDLSLLMIHDCSAKRRSFQCLIRWHIDERLHISIRKIGKLQSSQPRREPRRMGLSLAASLLPVVFAALLLGGCSSPAVRQQRWVAKPGMTFTDSAVFSYNSPKLLPQLAPGFGGAGAAQNSGCTSCR